MDRPHRVSLTALALSLALVLTVALALAACMGAEGSSADAPPLAPDAALKVDGAKTDAAPHPEAARGEGYMHARGCFRCHQSEDPADGILSGSTRPRPGTLAYPKNLTPDPETGLGDWSDRLILRAIREGVDDGASPLCGTMPRYVDIGDDEGAAIVAYLRDLPPIRRKIPVSACGETRDDAAAPRSDAAADAADTADAAHAADAADAADAATCAGLAGPGTRASCHACGLLFCQPNGCYGGYVCETRTSTCRPPPPGCTPS